jgi:DTW domain-containing protein YfiP
MTLYLLTHERELTKATNTGRLVKKCLGDLVKIVVWQRTEPDLNIVELINQGEIAMLYPNQFNTTSQQLNSTLDSKSVKASASESVAKVESFESFLILDSTWQEARKMYNRSVYLQQAKKISLLVDEPSMYRKRRNQIEGGLSTAECVIALLKQKNMPNLALALQNEFDVFNLS